MIGAIEPALDTSARSTTGNQPVGNSPLKGLPIERRVGSLEASTSTYAPPITRRSQLPSQFRLISLDEAISIALQDAKVLRSLSANVVQNAPNATTSFNPYIQSSDPNFGISAALAQFDTQLNASALYANNDDYFNNPTTTNNAFEVQQDLTTLNLGLRKTGFNGTQFSFNNAITHDNTTNQSVLFPSSWEQISEFTVRKPLLQGAGYQFNRIAGPNSRPGFLGTSGLLISRINHEVSLGEFERGVRELILEIIDVYWQLDLAYRNFETIKSARNASAATWKIAKARMDNGLPGGEADREAQARAQYLEFELQLDQALHATTDDGRPGVLQAEANLRRLLNLPQSDQSLLRPADAPADAQVLVDWQSLSQQALSRRIEIQQQQKRIQQRDYELIAARNFTLPRLDALATYRNSGFGDDLIGGSGKFSGALNESWQGNYDEWEFGVTLDVPIGYRQANAGVRHAQLQACRERAILQELEQQILHELGSALRTYDQSSNAIRLATLRAEAAAESVDARQAAYDADAVGFEDLLDAQQRKLEAELRRHTILTSRERALARLNAESGSLLDEYRIYLQTQ